MNIAYLVTNLLAGGGKMQQNIIVELPTDSALMGWAKIVVPAVAAIIAAVVVPLWLRRKHNAKKGGG
jgi:hypothetical protein